MSTTREPYDNTNMPPNEPARRSGLSTADMAAAAKQQTANEQMKRDAAGPPRPANVPNNDPGAMQANNRMENAGKPGALLAANETGEFRSHWDSIQAAFVDQPRSAVEQADALVAEVMKRLAETFAGERAKLEGAWSRGDNVSTEDLRVALQRYRSFFDRLLYV